MASASTDLRDVGHLWGGDLQLGCTGDLAHVTGSNRSRNRVLRRLLTVAKTYLTHPGYGAGLPIRVGSLLTDVRGLESLILGQMRLEASVSRSPAPTVRVTQTPTGVHCQVNYTVAPTRQPAALSFSVAR